MLAASKPGCDFSVVGFVTLRVGVIPSPFLMKNIRLVRKHLIN